MDAKANMSKSNKWWPNHPFEHGDLFGHDETAEGKIQAAQPQPLPLPVSGLQCQKDPQEASRGLQDQKTLPLRIGEGVQGRLV
jgi:hypothetical protein